MRAAIRVAVIIVTSVVLVIALSLLFAKFGWR